MSSKSSFSNGNRVLASLSPSDTAMLRADLEPRSYTVRRALEVPNKLIKHIHFLDSGIASVVSSIGDGKDIEIGIIGREGVTGAAVTMGNGRSPHATYTQVAGTGQRITTPKFQQAMDGSGTFRIAIMNSLHVFNIQTAHTAAANARGKIEQRLARWLLMADDRLDGHELPLTHEFLSLMLAVHRPGVTVALQRLESAGLIRSARKRIQILNRKGLEEVAGRFYGVPERELRLLTKSRPRTRN